MRKRTLNKLNVESTFSLQQILALMPGHVYWKDKQGCYLGGNPVFLKTIKVKSPSIIVGKNDYELLGANYANRIADNDTYVINKKRELISLEHAFDSMNRPATYLSKKVPLYNEQKQLIGLVGLSIDITNNMTPKKGEDLIENLDDHQIISDVNIKQPILTMRQSECLYYLLRGMSYKEIALILQISPRTIENHIEVIKRKLNCHSKSQLVSKAIALGYISFKKLFN